VYLHGLVNDSKGKKMSKSKGNVVNPLTLTDKYGTDALRMALIVGNTPGTDVALQEDKVKAYKNFANKLWNISRFVLTYPHDTTLKKDWFTPEDKIIWEEFNDLVADVTKEMDEYHFYLAAEKIYHYIWHRFADKLIEESKSIVLGTTEIDQNRIISRKVLLNEILNSSLKLLHPFMPFVTEEIWSMLPDKKNLLIVEKWPS
jgi:valyl-tRNA synthetase